MKKSQRKKRPNKQESKLLLLGKWREILKRAKWQLERDLPRKDYHDFVVPLDICDVGEGKKRTFVDLTIPNAEFGDEIRNRFQSTLEKKMSDLSGTSVEIQLVFALFMGATDETS